MEIIQLYKYPESWSPLWIITNLITCLIEVCTNILDHLVRVIASGLNWTGTVWGLFRYCSSPSKNIAWILSESGGENDAGTVTPLIISGQYLFIYISSGSPLE